MELDCAQEFLGVELDAVAVIESDGDPAVVTWTSAVSSVGKPPM